MTRSWRKRKQVDTRAPWPPRCGVMFDVRPEDATKHAHGEMAFCDLEMSHSGPHRAAETRENGRGPSCLTGARTGILRALRQSTDCTTPPHKGERQ